MANKQEVEYALELLHRHKPMHQFDEMSKSEMGLFAVIRFLYQREPQAITLQPCEGQQIPAAATAQSECKMQSNRAAVQSDRATAQSKCETQSNRATAQSECTAQSNIAAVQPQKAQSSAIETAQQPQNVQPDTAAGVTSKEISDAMGVSSARMTVMLKKLAQKNLIAKKSSAADARAVVVTLTPQGRACAQRMRQQMYRTMERIVDEFGVEHLQMMFESMAKIHTILHQERPKNWAEIDENQTVNP